MSARPIWALVAMAAAAALSGCQEKLASPGECPGICPSDRSVVFDTVVTATAGSDSTFGPSNVGGYVSAGEGNSLRLSNGLLGPQEIGAARFVARPDSVFINGTGYLYTVDSVSLGITLFGRDPSATGLSVELFRLPAPSTIDSTRTYAQIAASLTPANRVAIIPIPDTLKSGALRVTFAGATLDTIAIPPGDAGVLALGYRLSGPGATGIRIGSGAAGASGPSFVTYLKPVTSDTSLLHQPPLPRIVTYSGFFASTTLAVDPTTLTIGGVPSSRAIIRFAIPAGIRDSSTIIRATLELVPLEPISGLPGDTVALDTRTVLADLGAKSPRLSSPTTRILLHPLVVGSSDTVRFDVTSLVTAWQPPSSLPPALFVALQPEGSSFSRPVFGSTRRGVAPRLRLTYVRPYPFETP